MRSIRLENVTKSFNDELILENINLTIPAGKFFALLGPSGSGKTTLLRLIGGFEQVDSGKIFLDDEDITDMPIHLRRINTVFQSYALFPHLNVFDNVAYSLNIKRLPKDIIEEKVIKTLKAVHLESHIYKSIDQLSGGQQQRVALARAMINDPDVLLLDETLAALDFKLREKMLIELIELQDKSQTTFIYITHDQLEALAVADQIAIMNHNGEIEQIGTPKEIYEFPNCAFVARFVGNANILTGNIYLSNKDNNTDIISISQLGDFFVYIPKNRDTFVNGQRVLMSIRPEKIYIKKNKVDGFSNVVEGFVESIVYHGRSTEYNVKIKTGEKIQVFEQNDEHFPQETIDYDNHVYLHWQKENVVILER